MSGVGFSPLTLVQALPAPMEMDVDGDDDGTQQVAPVVDYGVTVDFSELEDEEKEVRDRVLLSKRPSRLTRFDGQDGSAEMEETLQAAISSIQSELDKTSVNRKAIDRYAYDDFVVAIGLTLSPPGSATRRRASRRSTASSKRRERRPKRPRTPSRR